MPQKKFENKRAHILWRYILVSFFVTLMALSIVWKVTDTTIVHAEQWNSKADKTLSKVFYVQPNRGDILACDGTVLATNLTTYDICLDYRTSARYDSLFVANIDLLSDSLAKYYPKRNADEWKKYLATPLQKPAKQRKCAHILIKNGTYLDYLRILNFPFFREFKKRFNHGLYYNQKKTRMMPYGSMAKRSIGRCNYRRTARLEGECGKDDSIDVLKGYSGLESALDSLLYGERGTAKYVQLTRGVRGWVEKPAIDGYTLRTTIDINMQDIVETQLQEILQMTQADWGTCLLMEVETGAIKAISNLDRAPDGTYVEAMNYALQAYEPGSVMKPISMIVALEDNFAPLNREYPIGHSYAYAGGSPIRDTHSPAYLPVSRFIEYSSNIGMTKLIAHHYENGNLNGFRERLRELGFFDRFNTGMLGERPPMFPTLDPKAGGRVSLSRMSYGYSTMIPPLYTCAIYNAIANKGKFVRPRMVDAYITSDGIEIPNEVSYVRDSILSQKNAKILLDMLHSVVYGAGGTAKYLKNETVTIAGKTGTCRIAFESKPDTLPNGKIKPRRIGYKENAYRLAFCGVFPYENPKYTCMTLISNPGPAYKSAARTSGQVVLNVALKMYAMGMLDRYSDYKQDSHPGTLPTLYAGSDNSVNAVKDLLSTTRVQRMKSPTAPDQNRVPDVTGLGMRDALARIEDAGYNFNSRGQGFAVSQSPQAGTPATPGQMITVNFKTQ